MDCAHFHRLCQCLEQMVHCTFLWRFEFMKIANQIYRKFMSVLPPCATLNDSSTLIFFEELSNANNWAVISVWYLFFSLTKQRSRTCCFMVIKFFLFLLEENSILVVVYCSFTMVFILFSCWDCLKASLFLCISFTSRPLTKMKRWVHFGRRDGWVVCGVLVLKTFSWKRV